MSYTRQDLDTLAIAAGLVVRSNGAGSLMFFSEHGRPLFAVIEADLFDPHGMNFDTANVRRADLDQEELFPTDGQDLPATPASSPGAAVRSEDCSVSFEREG